MCSHDELGRLTAWNAVAGEDATAPAFFFGRTRHGNSWRMRNDLPDELVRELARLASAERTTDDLEAMPERLPALRERLETWAPVRRVWHGPAFRFPEPRPEEPTNLAWLSGDDLEQLAQSFPQLAESWHGREPSAVATEQGRIVSACYSATAAPPGGRLEGGAIEAGIDTLPDRRGSGLAGPLVLAWAREVRRRGCIPLYSTAWENRASRALAGKLELIQYASNLSFYV
ncbi:MAG: GNAT family N-acetyltransferase [Deltaproteobacteria bacterium]|nr:GNAT family N-acetyltransferase [Deltaproteobacteria bacterium]MBW2395570.1 GNAT family N-acetyltransferase [Deltaproteobacteria bacterium]